VLSVRRTPVEDGQARLGECGRGTAHLFWGDSLVNSGNYPGLFPSRACTTGDALGLRSSVHAVELVGSVYEADIPFVDQVWQGQAMPLVFKRYPHHAAQIALAECVERASSSPCQCGGQALSLLRARAVVIPGVAHTLVYTTPCELVRVTRPFLDEAR
jgi:hypothetical protein